MPTFRDLHATSKSESKNYLNIFKNSETPASHLEKLPDNLQNNLDATKKDETQIFFCDFLHETKTLWFNSFKQLSYIGNFHSMKNQLVELHTSSKICEFDENLFTLGDIYNEGSFDNIKLNFTGDHGTLIKQLLNNNSVKRNFIVCMYQSCIRSEQLLVLYDKNKLSVYSLSSFLSFNQTSNKQKISIPKLNTIPIPCIALSLICNTACDELLAVVGVKECHILQISKNGLLKQHL